MNTPIQHAILEYCANALWQIPLLAGTAWLALWVARPAPRTQHRLWVAVLLLAALMPLHGIERIQTAAAAPPQRIPDTPSPMMAIPPAPMVPANDIVAGPIEVEASPAASLPAATPSHATWLQLLERLWASLHIRIVSLPIEGVYAVWFLGVYTAVLALGALRILRSWIAAHRLVLRSHALELTPVQQEIWDRVSDEFAIRLPRLRQSEDVVGPVVVGILEPTLLLPRGFAAYTEAQMRAALCHELAHVVRRDYAANLVCQVLTLPVVWHPVTHWVGQRVARTREMICDGMAAERMPSEVLYARALLALAQGMLTTRTTTQAHGLGLLGNNVLEERMENLMKMKSQVKARVIRTTAALSGMTAAVVVAGMFHVTPAFAQVASQSSPQIVTQPAAGTSPAVPATGVSNPTPDAAAPALPASLTLAIPRSANPPAAFAMEIPDQAAGAAGAASAPGTSPSPASSGTPTKSGFFIAMPRPADGSAPPAALVMDIPDGQNPDQPTAVAHGKGSTVSGAGHYHSWTSLSGEPFVILNHSQAEPTDLEKRQIEHDALDTDGKTARMLAKLNSPEYKQQMEHAQEQLSIAMSQLQNSDYKKQLEKSKKQLEALTVQLNSPEFKLKMSNNVPLTMKLDKLDAAELAKLSALPGAFTLTTTPDMEKRMDDATKRLEAATKQLEAATRALQNAQAQLQQENQK